MNPSARPGVVSFGAAVFDVCTVSSIDAGNEFLFVIRNAK
jgi:hypothetical protein